MRRAMTSKTQTDEARRALGLLLADLDRCAEALPLLLDDPDRDARLTRSRCQIDEGDPLGAHTEAVATAADATDPWTREQAGWLASVAALLADPAPNFPDEETPVTPMWGALLAEERAIIDLKTRLEAGQYPKSDIEP
jgi:hypothetical protein